MLIYYKFLFDKNIVCDNPQYLKISNNVSKYYHFVSYLNNVYFYPNDKYNLLQTKTNNVVD